MRTIQRRRRRRRRQRQRLQRQRQQQPRYRQNKHLHYFALFVVVFSSVPFLNFTPVRSDTNYKCENSIELYLNFSRVRHPQKCLSCPLFLSFFTFMCVLYDFAVCFYGQKKTTTFFNCRNGTNVVKFYKSE